MDTTTINIIKAGLVILLICLLALVTIPFFAIHMAMNQTYTHEVAAVVDEINPETGWITLVDAHGEAWVYEANHFEVGQPVIIEFHNMGTDDIYDDEIISIIFEKGA